VTKRKEANLPNQVQGKAFWEKDNGELGYWIKFGDKFYHVEFFDFAYTDKQQRVHSGHAWFILTPNKDKNWYTRGSNMVEINNELGLGWWNISDPDYQTRLHTIELMQITAAPQAGPVPMEMIAATMVAPAQQQTQSNRNRKGGLIGLPPLIFYRDRSRSEQFLDKFLGYKLINGDNKTFLVPYLKTALCLSYIMGPNVDAWANTKRRWLRDQVRVHGWDQNDQQLWNQFEGDFRAAFMDMDAKLTALQKFHELKMVGDDIDSYIANFNRLREESRYRESDLGAIIKFKDGLQSKLLHEVITHCVPALATLHDWKQKARERQTVYKELKNVGQGKKPFPAYQLAQYLGLRNYQPSGQRPAAAQGPRQGQGRSNQGGNQVVLMDVDAGNTGQTVTGTRERMGWCPLDRGKFQNRLCPIVCLCTTPHRF
jgi:hypothetical protein